MKDLILIGAHCPDDERENLLNELVDQLQHIRNEFDILICSHLIVPEYIVKKVDYVFYDKENDLIYETKYLNQPWFSPIDGLTILSTLIGESSTYLSVYRLLISGLGISKIYGYKKVHYIEYDTNFADTNELYVHSKLLNDYDWVAIKKQEKSFEDNLSWPMGNFCSFKLDKVDEIFLKFDRDMLLKILEKSENKTNEKITFDVMGLNGNKVYIRDFDNDISKKNLYGLSKLTSRENLTYWAVPYYDKEKDSLCVVAWNNKNEGPIDVVFIINNNQIISFDSLNKFEWRLREVGKFESIETIITIVNGKLKNNIKFTEEYKKHFKNTNYALYS